MVGLQLLKTSQGRDRFFCSAKEARCQFVRLSILAVLGAMLLANSCGSDVRLLSIQIYPADPNLAHNTSFYIAPSSTIQFQSQGWYSNRTAQTIANSSVKWSSTNPSLATADAPGLSTR